MSDPEVAAVVARLKAAAPGASQASKFMAEERAARLGGKYAWHKPEETLEWQAALLLERLEARCAPPAGDELVEQVARMIDAVYGTCVENDVASRASAEEAARVRTEMKHRAGRAVLALFTRAAETTR